MANFSVPKGRMFRNGSSDTAETQVAGESSVDRVASDPAGGVALERRLTVGRGAIGDIAAGATAVVMANAGDDSVSIVDNTTLTVVATVAVGGQPTAVTVSDDRAYVSVAAENVDAVTVIDLDTRAVITTYPVAVGVSALAVGPAGKRVYAGRATHDRVDITVIDVTAERVGTIGIGSGPAANVDALSADPSGKRLYAAITDAVGSRLVIVDTETAQVQRVVPVGSPIRDIAYAGGAVYVLTSDRADGGAVLVVDLTTMRVTDRVTVGGAPTQLTMSADQTRAYIVDYDRVAVLCTLSLDIVDSLTVDARPSCVTQGADSARLYLADYAGTVTVFSVESSIEALYSEFIATDPIAMGVPRRLQPTPA
ncbi:hypothetical protein ACNUDN_21085 [Mycobacterium sp. smrl_JER01]|uniref:hypothetical protein n=1 Tax=Mycobacterium sp. smrl_JER01 TaxID=3402633 RepID=UPI003ACC1A76